VIPIPAIDLKGGRCVRLYQGRMERETVYGDDPIAMARRWEEEGAKRLHVVDLDGAVKGRPVHRKVIQEIAKTISIPVEVGGGIRSFGDMEAYYDAGVQTVIVGTMAFLDPEFLERTVARFPNRIAIAMDTDGETVVVKGWQSSTEEKVLPWLERLNQMPIFGIIHTDIRRDGTQQGANVEILHSILEKSDHPIIASGGIGALHDLERLRNLTTGTGKKFYGVIIGRALYEGRFTLEEASRCLEEGC